MLAEKTDGAQAKSLFWWYSVFRVKLHLPPLVTPHPHGGDICLARQRSGATSRCLSGVINDGGNVGREELHVWLKNLDWSESATLMKAFDECQHLIPVPYLLLDIGEVGKEQFRKALGVAICICLPESVLLREDRLGSVFYLYLRNRCLCSHGLRKH